MGRPKNPENVTALEPVAPAVAPEPEREYTQQELMAAQRPAE